MKVAFNVANGYLGEGGYPVGSDPKDEVPFFQSPHNWWWILCGVGAIVIVLLIARRLYGLG
ncbi:MAG: hypothetical protein U0905_07735 [Pirellulales bacterium]